MSTLSDIRQDVYDLLVDAVPDGTLVYEYLPDDIQDAPAVMIGYLTVQRSFVTSGMSIIRASVFVLPYRGAPKDTLANMDELVDSVWTALGAGGSKLLNRSGGQSQPQSAAAENITVGEVTWPGIRVDTDVTAPSAFC